MSYEVPPMCTDALGDSWQARAHERLVDFHLAGRCEATSCGCDTFTSPGVAGVRRDGDAVSCFCAAFRNCRPAHLRHNLFGCAVGTCFSDYFVVADGPDCHIVEYASAALTGVRYRQYDGLDCDPLRPTRPRGEWRSTVSVGSGCYLGSALDAEVMAELVPFVGVEECGCGSAPDPEAEACIVNAARDCALAHYRRSPAGDDEGTSMTLDLIVRPGEDGGCVVLEHRSTVLADGSSTLERRECTGLAAAAPPVPVGCSAPRPIESADAR
jgi:hypothetical protein